MTDTFEPLLTAEDAANALHCHPKTIQRMAREGRIPAVRFGRYWFFRASELDNWLRNPAIRSQVANTSA